MLSMGLTPALVSTPHLGSLADALQGERRLLQDLIHVLAQQRSGVADNDIAAVDDSVFAAQRVLHTLAEARRRRRSLLTLITGYDDLALDGLDSALGDDMTDSLREARVDLQETARALARELDRNRRILQGALSEGDRLIRALCGAPAAPAVYGANGEGTGEARLFIDRQI
jgi:flagellar biosynthesis/type III secretory pathway chaperone